MADGGILDQGIVLRAISCIGAQNSFFIHTQLHSVSYSIPIRVIGRVLQTFSKQKPSIPWKVLTWVAPHKTCPKKLVRPMLQSSVIVLLYILWCQLFVSLTISADVWVRYVKCWRRSAIGLSGSALKWFLPFWQD